MDESENIMVTTRYLTRALGALALLASLAPIAPVAHGAEPDPTKPAWPAWSFEAKGGRFTPEIDNWSAHYGSRNTEQLGFSLAYKFLRVFDLGLEGQRMQATGVGVLPQNNGIAGERVRYELYPLQAYLTLRGLFYEDQWVVPYVGGGWTRAYYRFNIAGQPDIKGSVDGRHLRAGLQLLLDRLGRADAANLRNYGIDNTYWIIEAQQISAKDGSTKIDVGGRSYSTGLLFEF